MPLPDVQLQYAHGEGSDCQEVVNKGSQGVVVVGSTAEAPDQCPAAGAYPLRGRCAGVTVSSFLVPHTDAIPQKHASPGQQR